MTETIAQTTTTDEMYPALETLLHYENFTSTAIEQDARNHDGIESRDRRLIFVSRIETPADTHQTLLHRRVEGTASAFGQGWITRYTDEAGQLASARVHGSLLNPALVHGRYYRLLIDGRQGMLVRYIDGEHRAERNNFESPFNIIAGPEREWSIPNDSLITINGNLYVEVEAPGAAEELSVDRQEPEVERMENVLTNQTYGLAEADDDNRTVVRPEPEVGGVYIYWYNWSEEAYVGTYLKREDGSGEPLFQFLAFNRVMRVNGERRPSRSADYVNNPLSDQGLKWVKAKTGTEAVANAEALIGRKGRMRQQLTTLAVQFEGLNESMNELADEHGWCPEYEETVVPLGFEGREDRKRDYTVEVSATIRITDESPTSRVDSAFESEYGISLSDVSNVEFTAEVTAYISVSEMSSPDDAANYVDTDDVFQEIDGNTSASFELVDWSIQQTVEAD